MPADKDEARDRTIVVQQTGQLGPAYFLAGNSYPRDNEVEEALRQRLAPAFADWVGQADLLARSGATVFEPKRGPRKRQLDTLLASAGDAGRSVLIGRSSGARVVTELAISRPVLAVICLGYPFQMPGGAPDARRFAHLPGLAVPTLMLQGERDAYGSPAEARLLAPSATILPIDADHALGLSAPAWDAACRAILDFCRAAITRC